MRKIQLIFGLGRKWKSRRFIGFNMKGDIPKLTSSDPQMGSMISKIQLLVAVVMMIQRLKNSQITQRNDSINISKRSLVNCRFRG